MKASKIKKLIEIDPQFVGFAYNGKDGNVDHTYDKKTETANYLLFYDGEEMVVHTIEEAMNTPFIDGRSLNDCTEELQDIEW